MPKINYIFLLLILIFSPLTFAQNGKLLDYRYLGTFNSETAKSTLKNFPPLNALEPTQSAQLYKITYLTTAANDEPTTATGLIAVPSRPSSPLAIVSYFHGTRVNRNDAPSRFLSSYYLYPAVFTNTGGYMLVMPDYLGLGDNDLALHPYIESKTLASSSIDMIIAANEFAQKSGVQLNGKLFLAGNSEGGFTTVVTYEALIHDHPELPVTATAVGSAPYDWKETVPFITTEPGPRAALYAAYFFYSMQTYFHYWPGLDTIFKAPYDQLIPQLFDGSHDANQIETALPALPKDLLKDDFFQGMVAGTDPNTPALIRNINHYDFTATSPFLMLGSRGDHDVPFHGAELAYTVLKAKSDKVTIKAVSDVLDHIQAFPYVTNEQLAFFKLND